MNVRFTHPPALQRRGAIPLVFHPSPGSGGHRTDSPFGGAAGHTLELGGVRVYLRQAKPGEDPEPGDGLARCGYHHIGIATKDVDALCLRLERHGAVVTAQPRQTPSGRVAFVQGPDRIHIECYDPVENQG